ncbi:LysR family transcriptional regulator [Methylobacterium sp. Gmos1]
MNPKLLRSFIAVVETGSFNRASARLRLTQPALSRQIKLLEDELGVVLFVRHGRGVALTEEGKVLRDHADSLLRHIEQVRLEIVSRARVPTGTLALGLPAALRSQLSGALIEAFQRECPLVTLHVLDSTPHLIRERILGGVLELGIISTVDLPGGLAATSLVSESLYLAGPAGSGLDADTPVRKEVITELPLVQTSQQGAVRIMLARHFAKREHQPTFRVEADSIDLMIDLVANGGNYTILPYSALRNRFEAGQICIAPIDGLEIGWVLARLADRQVSVPAQRMIEITQRVVSDQVNRCQWRTARLGAK